MQQLFFVRICVQGSPRDERAEDGAGQRPNAHAVGPCRGKSTQSRAGCSGTLLTITEEEFDRMKAHDWKDVPDLR